MGKLRDFVKQDIISKLPRITYAELETAGAAVELIVMKGDAIIQPQRADGQVKAQTKAPVVVQIVQVEVVRPCRHVANIVEERETQTLDYGDAVLGRAEPVSVAADRLIDPRLARADASIFKAAQCIQAAKIVALV